MLQRQLGRQKRAPDQGVHYQVRLSSQNRGWQPPMCQRDLRQSLVKLLLLICILDETKPMCFFVFLFSIKLFMVYRDSEIFLCRGCSGLGGFGLAKFAAG